MNARFVALLRGINVGKARRVAMADLKMVLEGLGYGEVVTLLNSGNVVFTAAASADPMALARGIQTALAQQLGVAAPVLVLPGAAVQAALADNPLQTVAQDDARLLLAFSQDAATLHTLTDLATPATTPQADALVLGVQTAYVWCPNGVLASPLLQALDRRLGDRVTTRNVATARKIAAKL